MARTKQTARKRTGGGRYYPSYQANLATKRRVPVNKNVSAPKRRKLNPGLQKVYALVFDHKKTTNSPIITEKEEEAKKKKKEKEKEKETIPGPLVIDLSEDDDGENEPKIIVAVEDETKVVDELKPNTVEEKIIVDESKNQENEVGENVVPEKREIYFQNREILGIFRSKQTANEKAKSEFFERMRKDGHDVKQIEEDIRATEEFFSAFTENDEHKYNKTIGEDVYECKVEEYTLK